MPLLVNLCKLTNSCLKAIRKLPDPALASFLEHKACMVLASVILGSGTRVLLHVDRSPKRERSQGYVAWNKKVLDLTKNFQEFIGEQVQQNPNLKAHAGDVTIGLCNILPSYAEKAGSDYAYLNMAFRFIVMLVPNCEENRARRLDTQSIIRLLLDGILGAFGDILRTYEQSSQVAETYFARRSTLAKFYIAHLRALVDPLFKGIYGSREDAATCRELIRFFLFFTRSRFISSESIRRNHPEIQSEIVKFVGHVEEIVVSAMIESKKVTDDEKRALIHEFAMATGPRAAFDCAEPLSDYEWDVGRLKFLLKTISMFDEMTASLQLQLYPPHEGITSASLLNRIVDCVNTVHLSDFVPGGTDGAVQENSDLYFRILSELCTFAFLIQPKQFARLQVDMVGLLLGRSELWSLVASDWWICIAQKLGQAFTLNQILVLLDLLASLPVGRTCQKIGDLIGSLIPLLNDQAQLSVTQALMALLDQKPHQSVHTVLSCFPYSSLGQTNMDLLVSKCTDGWRNACDFLSNERLVLDAFYTMHQYVACLASIFSKKEQHRTLSDETRLDLVGWGAEIIGGVHELLVLVHGDRKALFKVRVSTKCVVFFRHRGPNVLKATFLCSRYLGRLKTSSRSFSPCNHSRVLR
ncbi:hypothetical protein BC939DRAFT_206399 [Gamsiella multidivaricata]|uniref:uncharacterized protein n=1 Tax=Gamsiella multidivaricata TaxID=101098 RepID=UPI00221E81FD|nr:uncharacterized protein BC939DRAFT_206399 [Gamsiella multidivaricata]KAI7821582.1 hypothetical protein BC939DRAFT_206399 [Gamsiella multidivaricata]